MPILLIIFMGVFDFGWILHKQIQLNHATREAGRRAAVGADNQQISSLITELCAFQIDPESITVEVFDQNGDSVGNPENRSPQNLVRVSIELNDVELVTPIKSMVCSITTVNLKSQSTFMIE